MRKISTRDLTLAAVVAAIYFVLCYFGDIFSLTFPGRRYPAPCMTENTCCKQSTRCLEGGHSDESQKRGRAQYSSNYR